MITTWVHRLQLEYWGDTFTLLALALFIAGPRLGSPAVLVFDEAYYVSDAVSHLEHGVGQGFQAHPPLGTWLIAAGISVAGETPAGWRLIPLAFGCITVMALHRLSLRLFRGRTHPRAWAVAAPVLLMVDGSWFTMSRLAMLDGLLSALVLLAVLAGLAHAQNAPQKVTTWPLIGAGVASGAATAVKLSGVAALALVPGVVYLVRRGSTPERVGAAVRTLLGVGGIAVIVYSASWVPFAATRDDLEVVSCWEVARPCPTSGGVTGVIQQHAMFFRFHRDYVSPNRETSPPGVWPFSVRPVTLYTPGCHPSAPLVDVLDRDFDCADPGPMPDTITYRGNPVVWLGFLGLLPLLAASGARDLLGARIALLGWAAQWLPWLIATRSSFLFYMTPAVPFMTLGIVGAIAGARRVGPVFPLLAGGLAGAATVGAVLLVDISPAMVPVAMGATGMLTARPQRAAPQETGRGSRHLLVLGGMVAAAAIAFVVMLPDLTTGLGG